MMTELESASPAKTFSIGSSGASDSGGGTLVSLADVLADGGLPQPQTPPRFGEVPCLSDGDKTAQLLGIEHGGLSIAKHDSNNICKRYSQ